LTQSLEKANVHFMDSTSIDFNSGLVAKTQQLFEKADLKGCFKKGDRVAVKVHMGEWGNTAYLRPVLVRVIVDKIKESGGKPFVTDTTTLPYYTIASRQTAEDYLITAAYNGFTEETMGCPIVIADGPFGLDDIYIDFPEGIVLDETYIAKAIAEADAMIAVSHFKGHDWGVYGGSIKNIGVGCVSKRGKTILHMCLHPKVGIKDWEFDGTFCKGKVCEEWTVCQNLCPAEAIEVLEDKLTYDLEKCIGCLACCELVYKCSIRTMPKEWYEYTVIGMADSASAVIKCLGKEKAGFITFGIDISPSCDCGQFADRPIMPNLGVFASKDMVAIDTAALDMTMQMRGIVDSLSEERGALDSGTEKFTLVSSEKNISQWIQINVCDELGVGTKNYDLLLEPVSKEWWKFCFPKYRDLKKPPSYYFRKYFADEPLVPPKGFKWKAKPRISVDQLSKR